MRAILDRPERTVIPLVILAGISGMLRDVHVEGVHRALATPRVGVIVCVVIVINMVLMIGVLYLFGWVAQVAGRWLEGAGTARDLRAALAWGCAPIIWALLYRIPAALLVANPNPQLQIDARGVSFAPGAISSGCGTMFLFGTLEFIVFVVWLTVTAMSVAEAHRFSTAKGFGTVGLAVLAPIVVVAAAVLAFAM